jgi:demethylspheroidene O-methyltransferase
LGPRGAAALGTPGLAGMIAHHRLLYRDLLDPVAFFRSPRGGGALNDYWAYAGAEAPAGAVTADRAAPYSDLMAATQPMVASQILDAYPLGGHRRLLDIAGGAGAFAAAALARCPTLSATVFDLPAVAERARARFAADGLGARADAVGGDLFSDALPRGADLLSLVRVLHDHDDAAAARILRAARAACPTGGALLIAEPMAETPGARSVGDAYFGVYLFAMGQGRARTVREIAQMARAAGFSRIAERPTAIPLIARLVVARP